MENEAPVDPSKPLEAHDLPSSNSSSTMPDDDGTEKVTQETVPDVDAEAHRDQPPAPDVDVPPNGGYGWVVTACTALINAHTWGINSSYGVFLSYYLSNNVFPGATSLDFAFVGGLSISMALAVSPIATTCTRIAGTRATLLIGVLFETAALLGASFAREIWQLFLSQGLCFGWGMGFLFVGSVGVVPQWFSTRRSFANSIAAAGSGIGGLIYSLATNTMIKTIGIGWAFRTMALVAFFVNTICSLLIKDRNKAVGAVQGALDLSWLRHPQFLLLMAWGFFSMLGYVACLFSMPDYATSIGLSSYQGSIVGAILNLGQGVGRPLIGLFSDNFGRLNMAATCSFAAGLFILVIWIFAKSYGVLIFFVLIQGMVAGTFWATVAPVGAEAVGIQNLPSALSILWLFLVLPTTFSEPISLELRATTGNIYLSAQIFSGFMYIGAAMCVWALRVWKVSQLDQAAAEKLANEEEENKDDVQAGESGSPPAGSSRRRQPKGISRYRGLWAWQRV